MVKDTENSSLPLLLALSGAVLLVAVGGWFFLDQAPEAPVNNPQPLPEEMAPVVPAESSPEDLQSDIAELDIDAELLKAQLAAEADILIFPRSQSALSYYGNILDEDPQHAIANAELDAVLARVGQTVAAHLTAEEFGEAYDIATIVAAYRPEHFLVISTQRALDSQAETLIARSIELTQSGDDEAALDALAAAEGLPGRNAEYFVSVRESIAEIQQVRLAAEQDRLERSSILVAEQARDAWIESTRKAIADGNLISPAGASARDLIAEENDWDDERSELTAELIDAIAALAAVRIDQDQPAAGDALIEAAADLGADSATLDPLYADLEDAFVRQESSRVLVMNDMVATKTPAPNYPHRARERGTTGSVELEFTVTTEGQTSDVVIISSEPEEIFDTAAIAAVRKWEFEPREYRGRTIDQRVMTRLVFRLEE